MRVRTILLTLPVCVALTQPLWAPNLGSGILGEVALLGLPGAVIALAVFFGLVALYVLTLRRLLATVRPESRRRSVRSLWLMFAIPLNFIEDFEIVADIAASLRAEGVIAPGSVRAWHVIGVGWCTLQLVSLLPGVVGLLGGLGAIVLWGAHWVHTGVLIRRRTAD